MSYLPDKPTRIRAPVQHFQPMLLNDRAFLRETGTLANSTATVKPIVDPRPFKPNRVFPKTSKAKAEAKAKASPKAPTSVTAVPSNSGVAWSTFEDSKLRKTLLKHGKNWDRLFALFDERSDVAIQVRTWKLIREEQLDLPSPVDEEDAKESKDSTGSKDSKDPRPSKAPERSTQSWKEAEHVDLLKLMKKFPQAKFPFNAADSFNWEKIANAWGESRSIEALRSRGHMLFKEGRLESSTTTTSKKTTKARANSTSSYDSSHPSSPPSRASSSRTVKKPEAFVADFSSVWDREYKGGAYSLPASPPAQPKPAKSSATNSSATKSTKSAPPPPPRPADLLERRRGQGPAQADPDVRAPVPRVPRERLYEPHREQLPGSRERAHH